MEHVESRERFVAAKVMQLVNELTGQGRWDEAYSVLLRFAAQQPNDPQIEYQLGMLCFNMGKFPESERHLKTALSINTESIEAHYQLGLILLKQNRPSEAMAEFREACELQEGFAVGHLHWGISLSQMGSWRGALGQYGQAIKLNPQLVVAHYQAGLACLELGQLQDAGQYFRNATNLDPNLAEAFHGIAMTLMALGRHADALPFFSQATQLNNQLHSIHRNWANALISQGKFDEASRHFQEAVNAGARALSAKERALIYNDWGVSLFHQGKLDEAAEKLTQAVDVDATLLAARLNLGLVHNGLQEYEMAADAFEKAIQEGTDRPEPLLLCGITYLFLGRSAEALERFDQARARGMNSPELNLWLGYAHMALSNKEVAEQNFAIAVKESPQSYLAIDAWGVSLAELGRHPEAVERFGRSINLNRNFSLAYMHLARSLEAMGRKDEARATFKVAVEKDPNCLSGEKETLEVLLKYSHYELAMNKSLQLLDIAPADADAQLTLARSLKGQNRLNECVQVLDSLIDDHPECGPAHALIGLIYLGQGKLSEADEKFRQASLLFEGDVTLYYSWGKTLSLLGLHEMAVEKFQKAVEFDPYDGDTYEAWGATLKVLGRFQEAAEVYKRAAEYI